MGAVFYVVSTLFASHGYIDRIWSVF
jgi:hypothetical protein